MATDNKILWFGAGVVGTLLLLRYYSKKKPVKVEDLKNDNPPIVVAPSPTPAPSQPASALTSNPVTLSALGSGVKPPIYINAENLEPNIYDRGVGAPMFMNATGGAPTNIQAACKCAGSNRPKKTILSQFNP